MNCVFVLVLCQAYQDREHINDTEQKNRSKEHVGTDSR